MMRWTSAHAEHVVPVVAAQEVPESPEIDAESDSRSCMDLDDFECKKVEGAVSMYVVDLGDGAAQS